MASLSSPAVDPVLARMGELLGTSLSSEVDVLQLVRNGLTARMWTALCQQVTLPADQLVSRNEARMIVALERRFSPAQTDRILEAARVVALAWVAHGDLAAAMKWLANERNVLPGCPPVNGWTLASSQAGVRLIESMLGAGGVATPLTPPAAAPAPSVDTEALLAGQANMTQRDLDWADALEEQRASGPPPIESALVELPPGVDADALLAEVAVDSRKMDWAAALAEQAAAERSHSETMPTPSDVDDLLADVLGQERAWQAEPDLQGRAAVSAGAE